MFGYFNGVAYIRLGKYIIRPRKKKSNGDMLVLLDLSASFDIIDHDNLFCILQKYVGICGNALKLIKSYFSNRTQRVQIDNVLSDFANIICGVPQGSVLGPLNLVCTYC